MNLSMRPMGNVKTSFYGQITAAVKTKIGFYILFCYEVNRQDRPDTITMKYYKKDIHVMRCAIWYHLHNFKNVKNTHGGVLLLVKLQALAFSHLFCRFFSSSNKNRDETNEKCLRFSWFWVGYFEQRFICCYKWRRFSSVGKRSK